MLFRKVVASAKDRSCLRRLMNRGVIRMSGFTPSDAAHILGYQSQWNKQAALYAAELLGRATGRVTGGNLDNEIIALANEVYDAVVDKSTRLLINQLAGLQFDVDDPIITAAASGSFAINDMQVQLSSRLPIVAVGGPAKIFYPNVGKRLGQEVLIPEYSHVANAVGAAIGLVKSSCSIEITLHQNGKFLIHANEEVIAVELATDALDQARQIALQVVKNDVVEKGGKLANDDDIKVNISRVEIPGMEGDTGLISAKVKAECEGIVF